MTEMPDYFSMNIESAEDAREFLSLLFADDLGYHPEDDARDIVYSSGNLETSFLFTVAEAQQINKSMNKVWLHLDDPCGFVLNNLIKFE